MANNYFRANSICPDPHAQLQDFVKNNDRHGIEKLVKSSKDSLLQYEYLNGKTILEQACHDFADQVHARTIQKLLDLGADPMHTNEQWQYKSSIHFAALGQKPEILKTIIKSLKKEDINTTANGNTALHIITKEVETQKSTYLECIRILVDNGIDTRRGDKKNNTALYWVAKKQYKDVIKYLLSQDARVTEKEAKELRKLAHIPVFAIIGNEKELDRRAYEYLRDKDEKNFIRKLNADPHDHDDSEDESFLQYACANHLLEAIDFLIKRDPNKVGSKNKTPPLVVALRHGYDKIVERLLAMEEVHVPSDVLNEILKRIDFDDTKESNYQRSCQLIINHTDVDVNAKDAIGNYPLHYAAKYGNRKLVRQLLQRKASLANRDMDNYLTITEIDHDTLKEHFDECIEAHPGDKVNKENMYLTFDYTTLLPSHSMNDKKHESDCEKQNLNERRQQFTKECDVVLEMSQDPDQKPLLQHPLIVSFLNIKWHRVRMLFYINLLIYLFFCASLLLFIMRYYNQPSPQNFEFPCLLLLITTIIITIRELFQMFVMTKKYFENIDNYIEVGLLVDVYFILFSPADEKAKRQMYAAAVLLAALSLLFLLGSVPGLSTYIIMLRTVSFNFCKFLMFNAILILAFAFCFYTLFRKTPDETTIRNENNKSHSPVNTKQGDEDDDKKGWEFFTNIFVALFKTLVMLTGEFEAGELDFTQYPVTSHLIFIMFIVLIAIILLNLLNGLAVSDTQEIKNEAKLVALTARAQYISYIESLAFDKSSTSMWHCFGITCAGCNNNNQFMGVNSFMAKVSITNMYLNEKNELKVYANQGGRIELQSDYKNTMTICGDYLGTKCTIALDEGTIKKARQIVSGRHHFDDHNNVANKINKLYDLIKSDLSVLKQKVEELEEKI